MSTSHHKRLLKFILGQLNGESRSQKIYWVNKRQCIFTIRWLHKANPQWTEEDGKIYEDYCKFMDSSPRPCQNASQSKARFRCALNKSKYIHEVKYSDLDEGSRNRFVEESTYKFYKIECDDPSLMPPCRSPLSDNHAIYDDFSSIHTSDLIDFQTIDMSQYNVDGNDTVPIDITKLHMIPMAQSHAEECFVEHHEVETAEDQQPHDNTNCQFRFQVAPIPKFELLTDNPILPVPSDVQDCGITVEVRYLNTTVGSNLVNRGCRIYYPGKNVGYEMLLSIADETLIDQALGKEVKHLQPIPLPAYNVDDQYQEYYNDKILDGMERGFCIYQDQNGNILAQRKCKSHVYYFVTGNEGPKPLERKGNNIYTIFDYQAFERDYQLYTTGEAHSRPSAEVQLCVGQEWVPGTRLETKYVSIIITHNYAAQKFNTSEKLTSVKISDSDSIDQIFSKKLNII